MRRVIQFFKRIISPKTAEDVQLNKYDITVGVLILFILVWGCFTYHKPHQNSEPSAVFVTSPKAEQFTATPQKPKDFVEGEFVGVRHFEVYGFIHQKKLQIGGYIYEVIYKDRSGILNKIEVDKTLLFRPDTNDLILNALHN